MSSKVLIIHGYSDCSASFADVKQFLVSQQLGDVSTIFYADYESREDRLSFNDVADGLQDALVKSGIINSDGSANDALKIIVHSTGGLVVRHWLWKYYYETGNMNQCPVTHIVMLAPANFGSPLAHRGKSFLGSLVKGRWKVGDLFEVGKMILDGLELASPFQWQLSHKDLLIRDNYFHPEKIKTTILVGAEDYQGIRGWINKPGTDGTVMICGTDLNALKLCLEFKKPDKPGIQSTPQKWSKIENVSKTAFGIVPNLNHGTIVEEAGKAGTVISQLLVEALQLKDAVAFEQFAGRLVALAPAGLPQFQQFVVRVVDDFGISVPDFTVEFVVYRKQKAVNSMVVGAATLLEQTEERFSKKVDELLCSDIHQNTNDKSFRRLLINYSALEGVLVDLKANFPEGFVICINIHVPPVEKGIEYELKNLQNIVVYDSAEPDNISTPAFFFPNTTTLVEMQVDRYNGYVSVGVDPRKH